jgi:sulfur carrier protein ThiS
MFIVYNFLLVLTDLLQSALTAEITQLNEQKAALLAENASLKEQLASLQTNPDIVVAAASNAELEKSMQATKEAQKRLAVCTLAYVSGSY